MCIREALTLFVARHGEYSVIIIVYKKWHDYNTKIQYL